MEINGLCMSRVMLCVGDKVMKLEKTGNFPFSHRKFVCCQTLFDIIRNLSFFYLDVRKLVILLGGF